MKFKHLLAGIALLGLLATINLPAQSLQTGAYIMPRVVSLWTGNIGTGLTLSTTNNPFVLTNLLNFSGFHNISLWVTSSSTNSVNNYGSNVTVNLDFSPGTGGGYTNSLLGTNVVFTTGQPWMWTSTIGGATNKVTWTNLTQAFVDGVLWIKGTSVTTTATNTTLEIDAAVTP